MSTNRDCPCFVTKFLWRPIWMGCLMPYSNLVPMVVQIRGQGALTSSVLAHHMRMVSDTLLGGTQCPTLDACESIDCMSTYITDFYIEYAAFYHGMFTLYWGGGVTARICVSLIELPLRIVMGWVPVLRYAVGCAWASMAVPHRH
jgi:hypothetical protein